MTQAVFSLFGLNGNNGFTINGLSSGDFLGRSVSSAGDVNGDGFATLLLAHIVLTEGNGIQQLRLKPYSPFSAAQGDFAATVHLNAFRCLRFARLPRL